MINKGIFVPIRTKNPLNRVTNEQKNKLFTLDVQKGDFLNAMNDIKSSIDKRKRELTLKYATDPAFDVQKARKELRGK